MRNRIAFALYVGPCWEVWKCCRLSARIPNHVSENRIHAPLNAGNFTSESGMVLTEFVPEMKIGSEPDVEHPGSSHFTVAATRRICFWMEARKSFGRRSACSSDFQPAAVFCAVSTAIFQSGLAGILALSAKRRICSGVISERLRLSPKLRPSLSLGI
jgi:hypothetical protein